jgi:hypothetical protein
MKISFLSIILFLSFSLLSFSQEKKNIELSNVHPALLLKKGEEEFLKKSIAETPVLQSIHNVIIQNSDRILSVPNLKYEKIGVRLLDVSRECLRRLFYLSYAYRITDDVEYAKRAEQEMLAVCDFQDWNPSHFLDVAEMTMGVSIGYDWTYDQLSESSKDKIANAILNLGIKPSMDSKYNWFITSSNNWNQVCNAGMMYGAIAIRDREPELSKKIIERSIKSVSIPMAEFEPDGTYAEGYMYWGYGTTYNVLLISEAEKFYNKEMFPASKMEGFLRSAEYMLHMVGTSGKSFNFSDCVNTAFFNPAVFWFAQKTNDSSLVFQEKKNIQSSVRSMETDRLLPAAILWGAGLKFEQNTIPKSNLWVGQGKTPVCLMRSSWTDPNAIFIGFKAGSPLAGHAHMDVGSFVMDALGERWASDFGMQDYNSLESKGVDLWNFKQNSPRWQVFRYNNLAHNTLTFNDSLQRVEGISKIDKYSNGAGKRSASSDLSAAYVSQVKKVVRTASIINKSYVSIKDEIETLNSPAKMRWSMLTEASPKLNQENNTIELTIKDKTLILKVNTPIKIKLNTWSTISKNEYDAPNTGKYLVGFEVQLPKNTKTIFEVLLLPQKTN